MMYHYMEHKNTILGHLMTAMSWMFTVLKPETIPIILSSIASAMAIVNYYYSIKKNRKR